MPDFLKSPKDWGEFVEWLRKTYPQGATQILNQIKQRKDINSGNYYRMFQREKTPITMGAPPAADQKQGGWNIQEYLKMVHASIDDQTVSADKYKNLSDADKAKYYSPEQSAAEKARITQLVESGVNPSLLPNWNEARASYVTSEGEVIVPNRVFRLPDGTYYDFNGFPVSYETAVNEINNYSTRNADSLSEYDRQRLAFAAEEAAREQRNILTREERGRREFEATQSLAERRLALESREPSLREQRLQFELDRQRSLASLGTAYSDPSGWIKRWQLQNMPNPFDAYIPSLQEQAEMGLQQLRAARQGYEATTGAYEKAGSPWIPMTPEAAHLRKVSIEFAEAIAQQQALAQAGEGGQPTGVPKTPPVPAWLSQFVPSQKTGQPVTAGTIPTPSGQLWSRTPWSQREMLRGYAEFAGGRPYEDIIGSMYSMFPREPRGAGSQRWLPARR